MTIAQNPKNNDWDVEPIVDQVWSNQDGRVVRSAVYMTVVRLLEKYDNAVVKLYVPLLVCREATELLSSAVLEEKERMQ